MTTPTHLATRDDLRESFEMLREAVTGLPQEALDWTAVRGANSIAVLVRHSLASTRFWVSAGSGRNPSHRAYVETERTPAFETKGESVKSLIAATTQAERELEPILGAGTDDHLERTLTLDDDEESWTGAGCLVHAASHLREHGGQVQLMRDLWLARTTQTQQ